LQEEEEGYALVMKVYLKVHAIDDLINKTKLIFLRQIVTGVYRHNFNKHWMLST